MAVPQARVWHRLATVDRGEKTTLGTSALADQRDGNAAGSRRLEAQGLLAKLGKAGRGTQRQRAAGEAESAGRLRYASGSW